MSGESSEHEPFESMCFDVALSEQFYLYLYWRILLHSLKNDEVLNLYVTEEVAHALNDFPMSF